MSLALHVLLSAVPSQFTISSSLRADNQDLLVELSQSSRPPHISGTLTHSFLGLRSKGVPQVITVEANVPGSHEEAGNLSIKAGTCSIRANRFIESKRGTQWLWALESKCPVLQVLYWMITLKYLSLIFILIILLSLSNLGSFEWLSVERPPRSLDRHGRR